MDIKQSLSNVYTTLNQLDIKATSQNVKMLTGVYMEIEKIIQVLGNAEEQN